ncbi:MAG: MaoC/PaaZ C-terminal domain-containing protein [Propionibacteriales bacterium]|nr:MaoC/PaaZ C-terminal domain-containing protein [Propionibacteriales bacterium]
MSDLRFNAGGLGQWTEPSRFEVTRERLAEYAAATNDPDPAALAGDVNNAIFAIVPTFETLMEPAIEVVPLNLLGRVLHGEQDFRFVRPIKPGDVLVSRGKATGWTPAGTGTAACVYIECSTEEGELVNEQYVTFFVRNHSEAESVGDLSPKHGFDPSLASTEPFAVAKQHVDDDQTFRYGPAAGDPMPIHLDDQIAREMGFPGIIAHGLCTQAFTSWAAVQELAGGDVHRLKRHAVRFAKPVLPGQEIITTFYKTATTGDVTTYAFQTTADGVLVVTDGVVEIAEEN